MRNAIPCRACRIALAAVLLSPLMLWVGAVNRAAPPADIVEVKIKNLTFIPDPVIIKVGQTVRWTNNDDRDYQIMAKDRSFQSPNMRPKEKFEHKFTEVGKFDYFDILRPRVMGTVEVNEE